MQAPKKNLKRSILIYILILSTLSFLFPGIFFRVLDNLYRERITGEIEIMMEIVSQNVNNFFSSPGDILMNFQNRINSADLEENLEDIDQFIGTTLDVVEAFESVFLLGDDGRVLHVWPYDRDYIGIDLSNQDYFQGAYTEQGIYWSDSFISSRTGSPTVALSTRCEVGVLVILYNLVDLSDFISVQLTSPVEFFAILDDKGNVVAHTRREHVIQAENLNNLESVRDARSGNFGVSTDYFDGIKGLVSVFPAERSGFIIISFKSYDKIFSVFDTLYASYLIVVLGVLITSVILIVIIIRKTFSKLEDLTRNIMAVADGSYHTALSSQYTDFRILIESFVKMVNRIKDRERDLKDSITEKETLLRELYHRTKNNMQVISSLLRLQDAYEGRKEIQDVFKTVENRIESIALVHEKLYRSEHLSRIDLNSYVSDLFSLLIGRFNMSPGKVHYTLDIDEIKLIIDLAVPCGLILNELITNSLSYAFPGEAEGTISVCGRLNGKNKLELEYSDDGIGLGDSVDLEDPKSLGFQLIRSIVEHQLGGSIDFPEGSGFVCRISFSVDSYRERV